MAQEHIPNFFDDPERTTVDLHRELARVLNGHGLDTLLGTPDHVLATLLIRTLDTYGEAVATTKRLAQGGPFQPFEHMSYDLNQKAPTTETVQLGGCRGSIEIPKKLAGDTGATDSMLKSVQTIADSMAKTAETFGRANEDQAMREIEMRIPEYNKHLPILPGGTNITGI